MSVLSALGRRGVRDLLNGRMFGRLATEGETVFRGGPLNGYFWTPHEELARSYQWGGLHRAKVDTDGFPVIRMPDADTSRYLSGAGAAETVDPFVLAQMELMRANNWPGMILENVPEPRFPPSRQIVVRDKSRLTDTQKLALMLLVGASGAPSLREALRDRAPSA